MCGIAVLFSSEPRPLDDHIRAMTAAVRHRGPDDEGIALFSAKGLETTALGGVDTPAGTYDARMTYAPRRKAEPVADAVVALGHRRLSIVDLSPAGHQPMCTADRRFWIVYNGEIYNYVELRTELELLGHSFVSHSDTEVILAAYREWGEQCLGRFNGMFAFVLVDRTARRVFAARDRFGVKPLYLWRSSRGLVAMASEIKQFSVLPGWSPVMNGQRAYEFLNWGLLDHTEETLFNGVRQLRGGECLHCPLEELPVSFPIKRWYQMTPRSFQGDRKAAADEFCALFTDAVRLRLRADVPVGSCLSGGLDSSSIVCVANNLLRSAGAASQQNTFSACAKVKRYDERKYIDIVVDRTGVHAHYVYPDLGELFETLDVLTWHQDEPFGSTSIYAQWHVFKLAAQARVKVLLDGQGADELLGGYHGFFAPHFAGLFATGRWGALLREIRAANRLHGLGFAGASKYLANAVLPELLRRPLRRLAGKSSSAPTWFDRGRLAIDDRDPFPAYGFKTTSVDQMAHTLLTATSVPMLLHWEDRDSMAHSVESRLPFLDFRVAEFLMGLPAEMKLWDATTKQVLRESMRGILPEPIRMRMDKMGFVTPEEPWVRQEAPERFRVELRRAVDASQGVINDAILDHFDAIVAGRAPFNFLIWRMISFGRWMDRFGVRVVA
ncbi:asparagine synthase (glutamine-hydrolyzing) [Nitrospira sp. NS4]|uniref:asparagine synthase (glutamine-hydrolyzing) n=1 Tax=Nitrospira sp. NS4 TaxID=3414498 RepID=UPI003C2F6A8D